MLQAHEGVNMCDLRYLIDLAKNQQGIDFSKLKPGTRVKVDTLYSTYEFTVLDGEKVTVKGGRYYPEEKEAKLTGSTWGGSAIKVNWVGHDMNMEIVSCPKEGEPHRITTSRVQNATVYGDGWEYTIEWD